MAACNGELPLPLPPKLMLLVSFLNREFINRFKWPLWVIKAIKALIYYWKAVIAPYRFYKAGLPRFLDISSR
jgi:hypothetical protein